MDKTAGHILIDGNTAAGLGCVFAGATVGAGSTVTKNVPAGKLTVARAKQVTLDGWKRPTKG